jgi:hypothetical protein
MLFRKRDDGSVAFKMGNKGAVLAILKPVLTRVDANGFVLEGWGYNNMHNVVKLMLFEGHYKDGQFVKQLDVNKHELREICDSPEMKLHGAIYIFEIAIGGDMAFQGVTFGHAGAAYIFFCFICDMARNNKHLTPADYQRKGMTPPMEKTFVFAAMLAHAFGEEYGLTEPYMCHGCGLLVQCHGNLSPSDNQPGRQDYQFSHFGQRHFVPPRYDDGRPCGHDWGHFARRHSDLPARVVAHRLP